MPLIQKYNSRGKTLSFNIKASLGKRGSKRIQLKNSAPERQGLRFRIRIQPPKAPFG